MGGKWEEGQFHISAIPQSHNSTITQSHMGATRDHETRRLAERRSAAGMPRLQTNQLRRFAKSAPLPLRLRFAIQNLFSLPMHGGFKARSIRRNVSEASFASHRSSFPKPPSRTPSHPRHEPGYARQMTHEPRLPRIARLPLAPDGSAESGDFVAICKRCHCCQ